MEHVPGGGDDYVVKAQSAVGENGLALLVKAYAYAHVVALIGCLLYTSPSPRDS